MLKILQPLVLPLLFFEGLGGWDVLLCRRTDGRKSKVAKIGSENRQTNTIKKCISVGHMLGVQILGLAHLTLTVKNECP